MPIQDMQCFQPRAIRKDHVYEIEDNHDDDYIASNLRKYIEERYIYDGEEFDKEKTTKHLKQYIFDFLQKTRRWKSCQLPDVLTPYQFFAILFTLQASLVDIFNYIDLFLKFGGSQVLTAYILICLFMGIPLCVVFYFLGFYSRQKYMRIWSCVPILSGMCFAMELLNLYSIIMNLCLSVISAHLMFTTMVHGDRLNCRFAGASPDCVRMDETFSLKCGANGEADYMKFALLDFLEHMTNDNTGKLRINWSWISTAIVLWVLMVLVTVCSKYCFSFICRMSVFNWIVATFPVYAMGMVLGSFYSMLPPWSGKLSSFLEIEFWVRVTVLALRRVLPGDLITYSAMVSPGNGPTCDAYMNIAARLMIIITMSNWVMISINKLIEHYKIADVYCIKIDGLTALFALIPDCLRRLEYWPYFIVSMYYLMVTLIGFNSTYFSINGLLEATYDASPKLASFKKSMVIGLISVCFFVCCTCLTTRFRYIYQIQVNMVLPTLLILFVVAIFIILYSSSRIMNDFHFVYGQRLANYWKHSLKFNVVFIMCCTGGYLFFSFGRNDNSMVYWNAGGGILVILPIIFQAITRFINYWNNQSQMYLLKPDISWGPPSKKTRDDRRKFNPKRNCRFRERFVCNHECLLECSYLSTEMEYWQSRQNYFYNQYHLQRVGSDTTVKLVHWEKVGRHSLEAVVMSSRNKRK